MPYQTSLRRFCGPPELHPFGATHTASWGTSSMRTTAALLGDAVPGLYTNIGMQRLVMLTGRRLNYATC